jgi:hypothetical protein
VQLQGPGQLLTPPAASERRSRFRVCKVSRLRLSFLDFLFMTILLGRFIIGLEAYDLRQDSAARREIAALKARMRLHEER